MFCLTFPSINYLISLLQNLNNCQAHVTKTIYLSVPRKHTPSVERTIGI